MLLSMALSGDPAVRPVRAHAVQGARPAALRGDHRVSGVVRGAAVALSLKDGFSLKVPGRAAGGALPISLCVADARADAAQIAADFVPIGPSVVAQGPGLRAEVVYRADAFHVRRGHRLVLALERQPHCDAAQASSCSRADPRASTWELREARYVDSRCIASGVALRGLRLQFGSVPLSAASALSRSEAR